MGKTNIISNKYTDKEQALINAGFIDYSDGKRVLFRKYFSSQMMGTVEVDLDKLTIYSYGLNRFGSIAIANTLSKEGFIRSVNNTISRWAYFERIKI